jgi:hypothetical protein
METKLHGHQISERLIKIKKKIQDLTRHCQSQVSPDQFATLITGKIDELETTINDYLSTTVLTLCRKSPPQVINLEEITINSTPSIIKNLKLLDVPYKQASGKITIDYYDHINSGVHGLNTAKLATLDDIRKYLNRLTRLRNEIVKAKYKISFEFYNKASSNDPLGEIQQLGGNQDYDELDETFGQLSSKYGQLESVIGDLITEQASIIADFEQYLDDVSKESSNAPIPNDIGTTCDITYSDLMIQYKKLEYLKDLLSRFNALLSNKGQTLDTITSVDASEKPLLVEAIDILEAIDLATLPDDDAECQALKTKSKEFKTMTGHEEPLINAYEDLQASVRIYLRLNSLPGGKLHPGFKNIGGNNVQFADKDYGPFFTVYPVTMDNRDIYSSNEDPEIKPMKGVFDQLKSGYSNFVFGYGYSGSGKTYSLFGDGHGTPGILQCGLLDLLTDKNVKIKYKYIFEIYGKITIGSQATNYDSELCVYFDSGQTMRTQPAFEGITFDYSNNLAEGSTPLSPDRVDQSIDAIIEKITNLRKTDNLHIKKTINNPESSRGHLFLTFEVITGSGSSKKTSYLTFVDMAGIESPYHITDMYFGHEATRSNIFTNLNKVDLKIATQLVISDELVPFPASATAGDKKASLLTVNTILAEGMFINETINHLKFHLVNRQGKSLAIKYQDNPNRGKEPNLVRISPDKYKPELFFTNPANNEHNRKILILPVLEFLESISTRTPSKFIMLSLIRIDCDPTLQGLPPAPVKSRGPSKPKPARCFITETLDYAESLING